MVGGQSRWKLVAVSLGLTLVIASAWTGAGQAQVPPPAVAPQGTPKAKPTDLLKAAPFDRITMTDGVVFDVEPLTPRPLPAPDKKKARTAAEIEDMPDKSKSRRKDPFERREDPELESPVIIHMLEGEPRDFKTRRSSIKDVEYFEDMLLTEADRLTKEGEFTRAFERIQLVKKRDTNWRGVDERVDRLLFEEGVANLTEDNAKGLRLLSDLHARKPDYPGLADRLAGSYARRITQALEAGDYRAGRRLIREVESVAPGNAEGRRARERFVDRARALAVQASQASPADRVDRLVDAARVWPDTDGLEVRYREAFAAEPTLTVAVDDLADPVGPYPESPAAARLARLIYLPMLASDDEAATRGEAPGQLLGSLETFELGKGLRISLKLGPTWSDGSRPVTAIDAVRSLADRALPASPGYNARWADLLDRVEATQEDRIEIRLTRPTMKPETWLLDPVGPAHAAADGRVTSVENGRQPVGDGPYRWESSTPVGTLLHTSATPSAAAPKIKRLREVRYPTPALAYDAFLRGEVAMLGHIPPERLADLVREPDLARIGRFATPSVHLIAFDGRNPMLRNRKLRRALSMAIDRRGLLEEVVLRHPPDDMNLVADGPFVRGSFVDATEVEPLEYNPLLAKALVAAARKEMGGNPIKLTLEYPSTSEARAACPKIIEAIGLIGVDLKGIVRGESDLEASLRTGRRFDLAYRATRPAQPLKDAGPSLVPGFDAPPAADALASAASPRILQLLIDLDHAPETTSARALAMRIDRESRDELPVLPLWQLDDRYAWRPWLKGPIEAADHLYQGIAAWEIEPWYVKD